MERAHILTSRLATKECNSQHQNSQNSSGNLVGIVNQPADSTSNDSDPNQATRHHKSNSNKLVFVFINAGFLHHIGPYRLYTETARKLAENGIASLRFDLSGIGDSQSAMQEQEYQQQAQHDIQLAMDFMQTEYGAAEFILCGLCSGADDALLAAQRDSRVAGIALLDGPGFRTPMFYLHHYLKHYPRRLFSLGKWRTLAARLTMPIRAVLPQGFPGPAIKHDSTTDQVKALSAENMNDNIRTPPDPDQLKQQVANLANQGTRMLFFYTGGVADYYNHTDQIDAMFHNVNLGNKLSSYYLPQSDHLLMLQSHRYQAIDIIVQWATKLSCEKPDNSEHDNDASPQQPQSKAA